MGGSSVLAAALLRCVGDLLGTRSTQEDLVYQVSQVEQILTTGGGWQDQVSPVLQQIFGKYG
jgi:fucokinase